MLDTSPGFERRRAQLAPMRKCRSLGLQHLGQRWRGRRRLRLSGLVDKPLVDDELNDFGLVREGVREAGIILCVFQLGVSSLSSLKTATAHLDIDQSADLVQALGPVCDSLLCRGLEVSHWPPCQAPLGANRVPDLRPPLLRPSLVSRQLCLARDFARGGRHVVHITF